MGQVIFLRGGLDYNAYGLCFIYFSVIRLNDSTGSSCRQFFLFTMFFSEFFSVFGFGTPSLKSAMRNEIFLPKSKLRSITNDNIPVGCVPPACQLYAFWWPPLDFSTSGGGGGAGRSSSEQV